MGRAIVDTDPTLAMSNKQAGGTATPVERTLSAAEIKELADKLPGSGLSSRLQAAIWLLLATGARTGELSKSAWSAMDLKTKTWLIPAHDAKNGRAHLIHLSKFALKQVKVLKEFNEGNFVLSRQPERQDCSRTLGEKGVASPWYLPGTPYVKAI